ncbi:DUF5011 domain-containing protein [Clostridium gasigenes]|nr:immunoglobulin-like domain-containing protein [Clostridium gasigenes]MBU3087247.1 DUF5011 domain-containing protein [Clostridium gasigenes]
MIKSITKKILATSLATVMLLPCVNSMSTVPALAATTDYGVGHGVTWPTQVNAPYVDMVEWITKVDYNYNGVANLTKLSQDTGVKYFNLGFIQATGNVSNGKVNWGWGGYSVLTEGSNDTQYAGLKQSIKDFRSNGGDVTISFGGLSGTPLWEASSDVNVLAATYTDIVNGYGLTRLDLDVEGGAQNKASNITNAKAIKLVQDATKVDVVLTLPVLPSGLTSEGLGVLEAYLANGVNLKAVNIMTMCYGDGVLLPGENYGTASVRAMTSTKDQLKDYYKKFTGATLSDADAYAKLGTTCSIGYEGSSFPTFTPDLAKIVVDASIKNKVAMTSYWSINRDAKFDTNQGITGLYLFNNVYKQFGTTNPTPPATNTAPVLNGVKNNTVNVGTSFNALTGITATDTEEGDLTSKIVVSGSVNTQVVGNYTLTYKVTDSKGLVTTATATVTVQKPVVPSGDTYDADKIYNAGDTVIYNGVKYKAKWWTKGEIPSASQAWSIVPTSNTDGSVDYIAGTPYSAGTLVKYNGIIYKANWWTTTTPGSDSSWSKK